MALNIKFDSKGLTKVLITKEEICEHCYFRDDFLICCCLDGPYEDEYVENECSCSCFIPLEE
jgi:hypothetical protein